MGQSQRVEAGERLAEDEDAMTAAGYAPASQEWAQTIRYGTTSKVLLAIGALRTAGGWLIAPPLSAIAMVFLVVGVLTRTRTGELTVTWTRAAAGADGGIDPGDSPSWVRAVDRRNRHLARGPGRHAG
jgi:hypothetical protein